MLSFTEIRSPFTMLAHSGLSPPEGWRFVRWYSVGNWQHWVSAKAGRPLTWLLVTFLLSPLGPPFAIWCSQQGCNPNQMWDLVRWGCRGGGASVGSVHCFGQRMLLDTLAMFLSNPESLSSNKRLVCRKSPTWKGTIGQFSPHLFIIQPYCHSP